MNTEPKRPTSSFVYYYFFLKFYPKPFVPGYLWPQAKFDEESEHMVNERGKVIQDKPPPLLSQELMSAKRATAITVVFIVAQLKWTPLARQKNNQFKVESAGQYNFPILSLKVYLTYCFNNILLTLLWGFANIFIFISEDRATLESDPSAG